MRESVTGVRLTAAPLKRDNSAVISRFSGARALHSDALTGTLNTTTAPTWRKEGGRVLSNGGPLTECGAKEREEGEQGSQRTGLKHVHHRAEKKFYINRP